MRTDQTGSLQKSVQNPQLSPGHRPRKRPDQVAEQIKRWIVQERIEPGGRLPQERDLIGIFSVSKGTVREALKSLEVQGLVRIRTGPGGGAAVTEVGFGRTVEHLSNYFYTHSNDPSDLFSLTKILMPELVRDVCGNIPEGRLFFLDRMLTANENGPLSYMDGGRLFDYTNYVDILYECTKNKYLSFQCRWLNSNLKRLIVIPMTHQTILQDWVTSERSLYGKLLAALRDTDRDQAYQLVCEHTRAQEWIATQLKATLERRFISEDEVGDVF